MCANGKNIQVELWTCGIAHLQNIRTTEAATCFHKQFTFQHLFAQLRNLTHM